MRTRGIQQKKPPAGVVRVRVERDDQGVRALRRLTGCVVVLSAVGLVGVRLRRVAALGREARRAEPGRDRTGRTDLRAHRGDGLVEARAIPRNERWRLPWSHAPPCFIGLGTAWALLPPQGAAIAIRCVVVIVFSVTPAIMWWLFLASQRASLLNEFLANLERLGLLEAARAIPGIRGLPAHEDRQLPAALRRHLRSVVGSGAQTGHRRRIHGTTRTTTCRRCDRHPPPRSRSFSPPSCSPSDGSWRYRRCRPRRATLFAGPTHSCRRSRRSPSRSWAPTSSPSRCCFVATSAPTCAAAPTSRS